MMMLAVQYTQYDCSVHGHINKPLTHSKYTAWDGFHDVFYYVLPEAAHWSGQSLFLIFKALELLAYEFFCALEVGTARGIQELIQGVQKNRRFSNAAVSYLPMMV